MAAILGVTSPTIRAAIDEGAPGVHAQGSRGTKGKIDATQFVPWWIERERSRAREKDKGQSQAAIERELDIEMKREKLLKEKREALPRAVMVNTLRDVATRLNVTITQMPDREADTIIGLRDRESAREALQLIAESLRGDLRSPEAWMPPELPQLELSA
ncbi:hypothetical protein [Gemmatimonas aurantiaca]|nr:hypothetical protein [Gemmatimonas aurantiaca]